MLKSPLVKTVLTALAVVIAYDLFIRNLLAPVLAPLKKS
jgi:hypothetical protein